MGTALVLARLQLRRDWRSLVPIVLLVAVASSILLWSFAAARRTDTAFDRMLQATEAWDVLVNPDAGWATAMSTDDVRALDIVADASRMDALFTIPPEASTIDDLDGAAGTVFASDGGYGFRFGRPILIAGRAPDPAAADELFVDADFAEVFDLEVGSTFRQRLVRAEDAELLMSVLAGFESGELTFEDGEALVADALASSDFAPVRELTVTGIGHMPDTVAVDDGYELESAMATPALFDELGRPTALFSGTFVRLTDPSSVADLRDAVDALVPDERIVYQTMANVELKAERMTSTPGGVLTVFAVSVLVLAALVIGQAVQRWLTSTTPSLLVISYLGASHRMLWLAAVAQIALACGAGFVLGAGIAVAASPLAPVGRARLVEMEPGWSLDWVVLGIGAAGLTALVVLLAVPAWRSTETTRRREAVRPSRAARWLAAIGAPLPLATGAHFALDGEGGGRSASRLAIVGSFTGVTLAVAALIFTASIDHVASTPRLFGTNWSATLVLDGELPLVDDAEAMIDDLLATVETDPAVRAASALHADELSFDGERVPVVAFRDQSTPVERTVLDGHLPESADEVAIGRNTLAVLGRDIGDTVTVSDGESTRELRVVGTAVLPAVGTYSGADKTALGEGAIVDASLLDPLFSFVGIAIHTEPGADLGELGERIVLPTPHLVPMIQPAGTPAEVDSLEALAAFPRWLAVVLVVLVGVPVVHSLLLSVRGRRRDLAVMSALGATSSTLRSTGVVQGLIVVLAGVVVGIPLGVAIGRWSWSGLAESFGTIAEPIVPVGSLVVIGVAILLVGALVGGAPVWRTRRGALLRSLRPE